MRKASYVLSSINVEKSIIDYIFQSFGNFLNINVQFEKTDVQIIKLEKLRYNQNESNAKQNGRKLQKFFCHVFVGHYHSYAGYNY